MNRVFLRSVVSIHEGARGVKMNTIDSQYRPPCSSSNILYRRPSSRISVSLLNHTFCFLPQMGMLSSAVYVLSMNNFGEIRVDLLCSGVCACFWPGPFANRETRMYVSVRVDCEPCFFDGRLSPSTAHRFSSVSIMYVHRGSIGVRCYSCFESSSAWALFLYSRRRLIGGPYCGMHSLTSHDGPAISHL